MSDTKADTAPESDTKPEEETPDTGTEEETPETGTEEDDAVSAEEYKKLKAKAARREDALRKAQARVKELEGKGEEQQGDADARANAKLVRASAKAVLASAGVTDKASQGAILELINLSDIEVDDAGDPDEDEISERVERLRKALGVKVDKTRRTPARSTSDRGGEQGPPVDPDSARYRAFLNQ